MATAWYTVFIATERRKQKLQQLGHIIIVPITVVVITITAIAISEMFTAVVNSYYCVSSRSSSSYHYY